MHLALTVCFYYDDIQVPRFIGTVRCSVMLEEPYNFTTAMISPGRQNFVSLLWVVFHFCFFDSLHAPHHKKFTYDINCAGGH